MIKKISYLIILFLLVPLSNTYAGSGSGIGPGWMTNSSCNCIYTISNITAHTIVVTFTPRKQDGAVVSNSYVGLYYDTLVNAQVSQVEMAPGKSCMFIIRSPGSPTMNDQGTLFIEWKNKYDTDNDYVGLVAHGYRNDSSVSYALTVNGGKPF